MYIPTQTSNHVDYSQIDIFSQDFFLHSRPSCPLNISIWSSHRLLKPTMPKIKLLAILLILMTQEKKQKKQTKKILHLSLSPSFSHILTSNPPAYTVSSIVLIYFNSGHFSPFSLLSATSQLLSFLDCCQNLGWNTEDVPWPHIQVISCWYALPDLFFVAIIYCIFIWLM